MSPQKLFRNVFSVLLGVGVAAWKCVEPKIYPPSIRLLMREENRPMFTKADAIGRFQLKYVNCQYYVGPEQIILIEKNGVIDWSFSTRIEVGSVEILKTQVVRLPGGSGVWFAFKGVKDNSIQNWDEIYVMCDPLTMELASREQVT